MLQPHLQTCLSWIRKHATSNTEQDLSANDTGLPVAGRTASIVNQQAESDHEKAGACDDEVFQSANQEDDEAEEEAGDDGGE